MLSLALQDPLMAVGKVLQLCAGSPAALQTAGQKTHLTFRADLTHLPFSAWKRKYTV